MGVVSKNESSQDLHQRLADLVSAFGGMVAFCVIVGDTIPHVSTAVFPSLPESKVLWLLADRRFIIIILALGVSYPLSLYRAIAKVGLRFLSVVACHCPRFCTSNCQSWYSRDGKVSSLAKPWKA